MCILGFHSRDMAAMLVVNAIHHFYIDHNALSIPPPPKSLHDYCSQFLLGITVVPREIQDNGYEKFGGGGNRVRDGPCENGKEKLFQRSYIKTEFRSQRIETFLFLITNMAAMTSRVNQKL